MAIVNSIAQDFVDIPSVTVARTNVATNSGNTNVTFPSTGSFAPTTVSRGKVRVKSNVIGTNGTSKVLSITGNDGTNSVTLYGGDAAVTANGAAFDYVYDFKTDLNLTSITVSINVNNNNGTVDAEICGIQ